MGEDADRCLRYNFAVFEQRLELSQRKVDRAELVERMPPVLVVKALPVRAGGGDVRASSSGTRPASQRDHVNWAIRVPKVLALSGVGPAGIEPATEGL